MKPDTDTIRTAAQGRWQSILPAVGIPAQSLRNKHQPCPACGGKDRFRFDDKDGRGTFYCSHWQEGGGDGFHLVMHFLQCSFPDALQTVAGILGMTDNTGTVKPRIASKPPVLPSDCDKDHLATLAYLWGETAQIAQSDATVAYLQGRGLPWEALQEGLNLDSLHQHPALPYWHDGKRLGSFPAMVGRISDAAGETTGLHFTYLQTGYLKPRGDNGLHRPTASKLAIRCPQTGEPLPAKKMRSRFSGSLKGASVKLYEPDNGHLLVCEGIETALAARLLFGWPVWACLSANGLQSLALPADVQELLIVADHDEPRPVGYQAAHALAVRAIKAGIKCRIWQPEEMGDALDEWQKGAQP